MADRALPTRQSRRLTIYADAIEPGSHFDLGEYTLGEQEIIDFADRWDPQPFHTDPGHARAATFGAIISSGIHTLAILHRLSVLAVQQHWAVIAGVELRSVRFLAPARPGNVLHGTLHVDSVALDSRRARGLVSKTARLTSDSTEVLRLTSDVLVRTNPQRATATPTDPDGQS
jgi:acyl dehydratase